MSKHAAAISVFVYITGAFVVSRMNNLIYSTKIHVTNGVKIKQISLVVKGGE